jgi:hypothetical protein
MEEIEYYLGAEINMLLQEDILAKYEFEHEYSARIPPTPERRLWLEVLAQAINDYTNLWPKRNQEVANFKEIYNWFFKEHNHKEGSFDYVCDILEINKCQVMIPLVEYSKRHI